MVKGGPWTLGLTPWDGKGHPSTDTPHFRLKRVRTSEVLSGGRPSQTHLDVLVERLLERLLTDDLRRQALHLEKLRHRVEHDVVEYQLI